MAQFENENHEVSASRIHKDLFIFKNKKTGKNFAMHCSESWIKDWYRPVVSRRRKKECENVKSI